LLVLALVVDPISIGERRGGRLALCIAVIATLPIYAWLRRRAGTAPGQPLLERRTRLGSPAWWLLLALAGGTVYGTANYYRFDSARVGQVHDHYDITYYYLNSKYFSELGYFELYPAMLLADADGAGHFEGVFEYRDLHSYQLVPRSRATAEAKRIRARFSTARWDAFRADVRTLGARMPTAMWRYFFGDHGYNPPPMWTVVGALFTSHVSLEHVSRITLIDVVLMLLLLAAIARVCGLDAALYGALFFLVTFSGDWPSLGQAILRFDWLVGTVGAYVALRARKPAWAGALLGYASAVRLFPAVFALPLLIAWGLEWKRTRTLPTDARRFAVAGAAILGLLVAAALVTQGAGAFGESATNLRMHASTESYSSARVGLGDALIYRGEQNREALEPGGIPAKAEQLAAVRPITWLAGAAALGLIALLARRRRAGVEDLMPLGFVLFFCLTTPQINYFNVRLLLVLWHLRHASRPWHLAALGILFGVEIAPHLAELLGGIRYAATSMTSVGLALYCVVIAVLAWRQRDDA
jgi:hypothetical protein